MENVIKTPETIKETAKRCNERHFYLSLSRNMLHNHEGVKRSLFVDNDVLLEWTREAEPKEIDTYRLIYLGEGEQVKRNLEKAFCRNWN